jgi:hypothetical protein
MTSSIKVEGVPQIVPAKIADSSGYQDIVEPFPRVPCTWAFIARTDVAYPVAALS